MTDVRIYQTDDGGEINLLENDTIEMDDGVGSAVYLSLFGGNEHDDGGSDTSKEWWGNSLETDPARKYRSKTQNLLKSIPATSANMRRIKTAAEDDLEWMIKDGVLTEINVRVYIPRPNWVKMIIDTNLGAWQFGYPWEGTA